MFGSLRLRIGAVGQWRRNLLQAGTNYRRLSPSIACTPTSMLGTRRVEGLLSYAVVADVFITPGFGPCQLHLCDLSKSYRLPMNYLRVLPFLAVLAVILFSGLRPEPVPQVFDQQDKLHHMLGFAALMFSLRLAFPQWRVLWAVAASLVAATLIEVGQSLLPHRQASLGDMLANTLGVLLGWGCAYVAHQWYLRRIGMTTDPEPSGSPERLGDAARP